MPVELRKRKEKAAPAKVEDMPPAKKAAKAAPAPKRKAAEDASIASPIAAKKQKPVKEAPDAKAKPDAKKASSDKATKKSKTDLKAPKSKKEAPVEKPEVENGEDEVEEADDRTKDLMARFDSDDEDEAVTTSKSTFKEGQDVGKIPKTKKADSKAITDGKQAGTGTVYVGRIPHGFYEHEMRQYFSQFGPITRLRLSRNKKTGASKHFAFVEFAEAATAEVVAKTMDNYLLFGHILRCKLVPDSQIHESLWKGANRRFKKVPWNKMAGKQLERPLSESKWEAKISKEERRRSARAEKLKEIGYEYEAPALKAAEAKPKAVEAADEVKTIEAPASESAGKEVEKADEPVTEDKPEEAAVVAAESPAKESKKAKGPSKKKGRKSKA
ncbi:RNA-binding domain-containing protein [Coniochaeta hoffmannii]|uniref:RNA-binding domain-containing protein n=1 Tax=Coniochaeta hoffmannii TaxID=91930 RepID=A0AA38SJW8_9PEZI|nr:RNA-binding domain-containing protein [Coniochaeta hoffmannii]